MGRNYRKREVSEDEDGEASDVEADNAAVAATVVEPIADAPPMNERAREESRDRRRAADERCIWGRGSSLVCGRLPRLNSARVKPPLKCYCLSNIGVPVALLHGATMVRVSRNRILVSHR